MRELPVASPAHQTKGFTLIELLVSLTVVTILAALAVPAFRNLIAQGEVRTAATNLTVAMTRARSEATKRSATIRVLKKSGGWATGWEVQDPSNAILVCMPSNRIFRRTRGRRTRSASPCGAPWNGSSCCSWTSTTSRRMSSSREPSISSSGGTILPAAISHACTRFINPRNARPPLSSS